LEPKLSAFQFNADISVLVDGQHHVPDMLLIELPPLCGRHFDPRISKGCIKHIVHVQMNRIINPSVHFFEECIEFDVLTVSRVEIIKIALKYP